MARKHEPTPAKTRGLSKLARSVSANGKPRRLSAKTDTAPASTEPVRRRAPSKKPDAQVVTEPFTPLWVRTAWWLGDLWRAFSRRFDEIFAILMIGFGVVGLLALLRLSNGNWLVSVRQFLNVWLGWGAILAPVSALTIGILILWKNFYRALQIPWKQILLSEICALTALGFSHAMLGQGLAWSNNVRLMDLMLDGSLLTSAAAGEGGGYIGWALAWVVSQLLQGWTTFGLGLLLVLALATLFGISWQLPFDALIALQARLGGEISPTAEELANPAPSIPARQTKTPTAPPTPRLPRKPSAAFTSSPIETAQEKAVTVQRSELLPSIHLLHKTELVKASKAELEAAASTIIRTLADFGVHATYEGCRTGPSVTQYLISPGISEKPGPDGTMRPTKVRVSQIANLNNDLALALNAMRVRIEAPVPGTTFVGIEVPNARKGVIGLRLVVESENFQKLNTPLAFPLGADVSGKAVAADLAKMPHLLVAGTTGSGKSVCITSIISCLVFNNTPEQLRLVLIDPKKVELIRFNGLPHLLGHVEVELQRIIGTLRWMVREMERRYRLFEVAQTRDLKTYNAKMRATQDNKPLPHIVVVVDELADLMMQAPDETERMIARLAQMARATGIHLVVATQRPSTDVVTGLIKANFPARIAFMVASGTDSRVILDTPGAENLLGKGDMLFLSPEAATPRRMQGVFVREDEMDRIVKFWQDKWETPMEEIEIEDVPSAPPGGNVLVPASVGTAKKVAPWEDLLARQQVVADKDDLLTRAIDLVKKEGNASASLLQRKLKVGYPRAARLMDELKEMGLVGDERQGGKTREVFIEEDDDPIGDRVRFLQRGSSALADDEESV
jgi:S-DNA-T family DNA segregation ATPase FtsK/SpoIIIE